MGFAEVYDYTAGKMDWIGRGRDYEGKADLVLHHLEEDPAGSRGRLADDVFGPGVSTVRASEEVGGLSRRLREHDRDHAVVTDPDGLVLGVFRVG